MSNGDAAMGWLGVERMVPSSLLPPDDPSRPHGRTLRDWTVDIVAMLAAAALGATALISGHDSTPLSSTEMAVDISIGAVAVLALLFRRRWPVAIGLLTAALAMVSSTAAFTPTIALFTVAVHRPPAAIIPVALANVASTNIYRLNFPTTQSWLIDNITTITACAVVIGFGMFVRARRQLVWTLRERAQRAEREQELLAERTRIAERARIAREMHDVLGHRLALLSLHAGGLEMRPDLPPNDIAEIAGLLRSTCSQALDDLRTVIGILREDGSVEPLSAPQPTLADLPRLVDDTRRAGAQVSLTCDIADLRSAPEAAGRVVYRVVQEALTNVAKHAVGAATVIDVSGTPADGIKVRVRNAIPVSTAPGSPGGGVGLIGLQERVELAGGTLTHGVDGQGDFVVEALLPWR